MRERKGGEEWEERPKVFGALNWSRVCKTNNPKVLPGNIPHRSGKVRELLRTHWPQWPDGVFEVKRLPNGEEAADSVFNNRVFHAKKTQLFISLDLASG